MSIKQDGTNITIKFDSEADAREAAATMTASGAVDDGAVGWLKRTYQTIDELVDLQDAFGFVAWSLLLLGCVMEFTSWSNLFPGKGLAIILGLIGVFIFMGTKFAAANWARAVNNERPKQIEMYRTVTIIGLLICALMASQLMASQIANEDQGGRLVRDQIEAKQIEVADLRREVRRMEQEGVSSMTAETIKFEISTLENTIAVNSAGASTGRTVAEWVGDCVGDSYYQTTYCDEIIMWKRKLLTREPYEKKQAELTVAQAELEDLRASVPDTSGAVALGQQWSENNSFFVTILPGILMMFIVAGAMVVASFLSKWNPPRDWIVEDDA